MTQPPGPRRATSANLVGTVVSALANLGFTVLVTRTVGRHEAGALFTATSLFVVLQITSRLGADTGATYFISRTIALGDRRKARDYLTVLRRPVVTASVIGCAGLVAAAFAWGVRPANDVGAFLLVLALFLPAATFSDVALAASRGFGGMRSTVLLDKLLRPVTQLLLVGLAVAVGAGILLPLAWAIPYAVSMVLAARALRPQLRGLHRDDSDTRDTAREFWRFTAPRALASVAQTLIQRVDIVLVAVIRGPRDAAIYTAATRFVAVVQMLNLAISQPAQPQFAGQLATGDLVAARRLYRKTTAWLVLLGWPLLLLCLVAGHLYLHVFGHGYSGSAAATVVVILAVAMMLAFACGTVDMLLIMGGRTTWNLATTLGALVALVAVDLALIPGHGVVGAAIGWAAAIAVSNLVPLAVVHRALRLHPIGAATLCAAALTAISFAGVPALVFALAGHTTWGWAVVGVAAGGALFVAGCWAARRLLDLPELLAVVPRRRPAVDNLR
ncbi:MAG: oligosaccharide flippase family protein [Frankiales bacterium]|nr:oligosaccharide flippase family protein [Frankiales bacterium]